MIFFKNLFKIYFSSEVSRFIIVGSSTVLLDLFFYNVLLKFGISSSNSKGLSFIVGAFYSYFANKSFTFNYRKYQLTKFILFLMLNVSTLLANVFINEVLLNILNRTDLSYVIAFLSATIVSATLNFLGLKYIVFR